VVARAVKVLSAAATSGRASSQAMGVMHTTPGDPAAVLVTTATPHTISGAIEVRRKALR
jgi:hypothetical protein